MLETQMIPVEFGGVDTKSDPKKVIPGKLLTLQNGTFMSPGQIRKRQGYVALPQTVIGGGTISAGKGLGVFNSEQLLMDGVSLYSYSPSQTAWSNRGTLPSVNVQTSAVTRNTYAQTAQDAATIGTLACYAWEDTRGGVRYTVLDTGTGAELVQDTQIDATGTRPKVLAFGSYFLVFVSNTGTLGYYYISTSTPTTVSAIQSLGTNVNAPYSNYDAQVMGGNVYAAYNNQDNGGGITALVFSAVGGAVTTADIPGDAALRTIAVVPDTFNSQINLAYYNGTAVKLLVRSSALAAVSSATLETLANVTSVTGVTTSSTVKQFYYTVSGSQTYNYLVRSNTVTSGTPAASAFLRSVALAGKAFLYSGTVYVPLVFSSPLQTTLFVADQAGNIVAKAFPGTAGGIPTRSTLAEVSNPSTGVYTLPVLVVDLLTTQPGTTSLTSGTATPIYTLTGVNGLTLNFADSVNGYLSTVLGSNLLVSGGVPRMYDGAVPVEQNFHVYPEGVTSSVIPFGGTLSVPSGVTTANYQVSGTYEWTDNQGQTHISSPSVPNTAYLGPGQTGFGFVNTSLGVSIGTINPAVAAYSAASVINVQGTTGNGSITVNLNSTPLSASAANTIGDYLWAGMGVSGPGIPAGTVISSVINPTQFNMSASAGAGAGTGTISLTFQSQPVVSTTAGAVSVSLAPAATVIFCGQLTQGSAVIPVVSVTGLTTGQTVVSPGGHLAANTTISSIGTNSITVSSAATASTQGYVALQANYQFVGTITSGSTSITGCAAADVAYASAHTGPNYQVSATSGIPAGSYVVSASGTTIVMSIAATVTRASTNLGLTVPGDVNLVAGQNLSGPNIQSGSYIASLSTGAAVLNLPATATASSQTCTVNNTFAILHTLPTLRLTAKQNSRSPVSVVTYRTVGNGTAFYRASSVSSPLYNSTTTDTISWTDSVTDTNLVGAPTLYTTGSVLENSAPPPCSILASHKSRVFALDTTNPLTLWYSQIVTPGVPVQFSSFLTQTLPPSGGNVSGLASMDDRLIIFKQTGIFALTGDGPDATGNNNTFNAPVLLPADAGCSTPRSVVVTPLGVMFQGAKGICLLDRSLSVQYIGKDVENLVQGQSVVSARVVQGQNQVRFGLSNGTALVFDLLSNQWSVFTNHSAVDVAFFGSNYVYLKSNGQVMVETAGTYTDAGAFVQLSLTTSWLQFAGIQGFQRVRRALLYGDYESPHNLVVQVAYDFNPTVTQTDAIAVTSAPGGAEQYRIHLAQQKCEALQFTISDTQNGTAGESVRLSGLTLEVGTKRGGYKVSAANSFG